MQSEVSGYVEKQTLWQRFGVRCQPASTATVSLTREEIVCLTSCSLPLHWFEAVDPINSAATDNNILCYFVLTFSVVVNLNINCTAAFVN